MQQERTFTRQSQFVDSPAAGRCAARAPLRIGMERLLVVDRDFFAGVDVSQSKEQDMAVQSSHEGIWLARVIDVVRAVAAPRAVQTEAPIDVADTQNLTMACAPASFKVRDPLAGVLSYLPPAFEMSGGKAALTVNPRLADCEAVREFHRFALYDEISPQRSQGKDNAEAETRPSGRVLGRESRVRNSALRLPLPNGRVSSSVSSVVITPDSLHHLRRDVAHLGNLRERRQLFDGQTTNDQLCTLRIQNHFEPERL